MSLTPADSVTSYITYFDVLSFPTPLPTAFSASIVDVSCMAEDVDPTESKEQSADSSWQDNQPSDYSLTYFGVENLT